MPAFIPFLLFVFFFVVLPRLLGTSSRAKLLKTGLEARGLILSASRTGTDATVGAQRFQVRSVVVDIEIMGRAPYEVSASAMFPRLCEPFPGAALDLRVNPRNPNDFAIVGPAGSSGWLGSTVGILPWAVNPSVSGCGTVVIVIISLALGIGGLIGFINDHRSDETPETPPAPVVPVTPHVTPAPTVAPTVAPPASHRICDEATRCCKTLGRPRCTTFASMSEYTCKTELVEEMKAAAKLHKTCE